MRLSKLVHEEHCCREDCEHCGGLGPDFETSFSECSRFTEEFKELYELCDEIVKMNDADEEEQQVYNKCKSKKPPKGLTFTCNNAPQSLRFIPGMVSSICHCTCMYPCANALTIRVSSSLHRWMLNGAPYAIAKMSENFTPEGN